MDGMNNIGIRNIGIYVPENLHTSSYIAEKSGIPEEVIREKFGINKKHKANENEHPSHMAVKAAQKALDDFDPAEIDLIIYHGSEYKDYYLYNIAAKIQYELGAKNAYAFEIHSLCSGGAIALKVAKNMMLNDDSLNNVLLVTASKELDLIDYNNQKARFMFNFGDGAASALLSKNYDKNIVLETHMITHGGFAEDVAVYGVGSKNFYKLKEVKDNMRMLDVANPEEMKSRLDSISEDNFLTVIRRSAEKSGYSEKDIKFLAPIHMKRSMHENLLSRLGLNEENSYYLEDYGHVQSADAFIALHNCAAEGKLKDGDLIVMLGAGTGYTWAATAVKWGI